MLKDILRQYYYSSNFKKYIIKVIIGILILFIFNIYLNIDYISIPLTLIIWISIRLFILIFLKDVVVENEKLTEDKLNKEKVTSVISIVFLILFYIFMRNYY